MITCKSCQKFSLKAHVDRVSTLKVTLWGKVFKAYEPPSFSATAKPVSMDASQQLQLDSSLLSNHASSEPTKKIQLKGKLKSSLWPQSASWTPEPLLVPHGVLHTHPDLVTTSASLSEIKNNSEILANQALPRTEHEQMIL